MSKADEKHLCAEIVRMGRDPVVKLFVDLLDMRLERYKDTLVSTNSDITRGQAMECRDLLNNLRRQSIDSESGTL